MAASADIVHEAQPAAVGRAGPASGGHAGTTSAPPRLSRAAMNVAGMAQIQRLAGNRAVGRLMSGSVAPVTGRARPSAQRCGDHVTPGCACADESEPVQRSILDDAGSTFSDVAADVGAAATTVAQDVSSAATTVADDVTSAASTIAQDVSSAASTAADDISSAATTVADDVSSAASGVMGSAVAEATSLATSLGGSVSIVGTAIVITVPQVPLLAPQTTPLLEIQVPVFRMPLLLAGAAVGPLLLEADIALEVALRPEMIAIVGPASLQGIRIEIDPLAGTFTAAGQLHAAASNSMIVAVEPGIDVEAMAVLMVGEVPVPIEIDAMGGLRLALRGSGLGSLDETVSLGYRGGALFLDSTTDLKLGARIDAELDASIELNVFEQPVCEYTWPLGQWLLAETAEQFTLPVSLGYSSGTGGTVSAGPATSKPIPVGDIGAKVPTLPRTNDCGSLDRLIAVLCSKGVIPAALCTIKGHGGGPEFDGPGPTVTPAIPGGGGLPIVPPIPGGGGTPVVPPVPGGGGGGVGPLAGTPSGKSRSDPIPLIWFKPLSAYPDPITLTPSTGGAHDYDMQTPGQFVEVGQDIGVQPGFIPELNKIVELEHVLQDDDRGPAVDRFRLLLKRHGRDMAATSEDADHVQDIGWGGQDGPENLWPLDSGVNQAAGRAFQNFRITYAVNPGEAPRPESTNQRIGTVQKATGPENIVGRFFIIVGFENP
jgi:hypothetical protein